MSRTDARGLTDPYKRRIDYLRVSVTDRCDLRCAYCTPRGRAGRRAREAAAPLTAGEIARFVRVALGHGLRQVRLTGGEPLLREDLLAVVSSLKALGVRDLSLTTNGIRLAAMARELKAAGLDRVNISLDTMDAGKYRSLTGGGDIRRVWEAIDASSAAGLWPVKLNVVPLRGINEDELQSFAALTLERDFHIRFIELMPVRGAPLNGKGFLPTAETMERISSLGRLVRLPFKGGGPSRNYRLEGAPGMIGFISPVSDHFCRHCNRLRLTWTGKLRPCLFSDLEVDIASAMRAGAPDSQVEALLLEAVASKPRGHGLAAFPRDLAPMSQIGG
ncbi:MAG: GTP 3',8-cyclase MoaA [Thermodesulfovibrionales bacterium]